jgi:hypothetical protein
MTGVPTKIVGVSYFYFPLLWTNSEFWGLYFDYQFRAYYPYKIPNWEIYLYNTEPSVSKLVETVGNIIYQPIFIAPLIISIIINLPYWYLLSCLIVLVYDNLKKRK